MNKQPVFPDEPQIPILPNMLTAGNLLCGFFAILIIFEGMGFTPGSSEAFACFQKATYLIFAACIFDLLDGRVARMCGSDGPFGREFDSIADVVSFGIAPAMLLSKAVLFGLPQPWTWMGWGVAVLYLLCAALRLARFNCMAAAPRKENQSSDFIGLPVPMAAGAVVSTMYLVVYTYDTDQILNTGWQIVMALAMAGVSILMMSRVIYLSFKHITFKKKTTAIAIVGAVIAICALVAFPWVMPAVLFCLYLLYGLLMRPWLTRRWQARIEAMDDEDEES